MNTKWVVVAFVLCIAFVAASTVGLEAVYAARDDSLTGDKDLAAKKGVAESLGTKKFDQDKLPGKWKIGFALGSVVAAMAVLKYL